MFTGIVEGTGTVDSIAPSADSIRLKIQTRLDLQRTKIGDSIAVNGCCLTVVGISGRGKEKVLEFDLLKETWKLTNLQFTQPGSLVNLEHSLAANGRLHGHFVTGHIDG